LIQRRVLAPALRSERPLGIPRPLRLLFRTPILRSLPARIVGFGFWPMRVKRTRRRVVGAG
ncbi:MAG: FAD-dependent oxidoreductase, partial [Actinomycetota bacterium]|nr:FAD-dependent oxidoreductase [Actinomycetota bacterium]